MSTRRLYGYKNIFQVGAATWKDIETKYPAYHNTVWLRTVRKLIPTLRFPVVGTNISIIVNLSSAPSYTEAGISYKTEEAIT